jgi:adenosylmethionine-8-amino-7-oxononanoate aminotransferase
MAGDAADGPWPDGWATDLAFDREHLWHPYASMTGSPPVLPVVRASGVRLILADGRELIDGMASWWAVIHGYQHPALIQALADQSSRLAHVMYGGLTHAPAIALARKLLAITPTGLEKVFLSDSGSVAVEVAIKMALQYWQASARPAKRRLLALTGGYHGDTLGAMSVCDPVTGMHHLFNGALPPQIFAPRPSSRFGMTWDPEDAAAITRLVEEHHRELAAVILEPVVQGAGGMWFYHPEYLRVVRQLCDEYGVLLIADEIATGFGRTGRMFACDHAGIVPDILCLGKALTGGCIPLAATMTTERISTAISRGAAGCFMHGPTFMANPLACAVACASIDLLLAGDWRSRVESIACQLQDGLAACVGTDGIRSVRVLGAIGVIEMTSPVDLQACTDDAVHAGVWLRPFGKLIYAMPSYGMSVDELRRLTRAMRHVAQRQAVRSASQAAVAPESIDP